MKRDEDVQGNPYVHRVFLIFYIFNREKERVLSYMSVV